MTFWALVVDRGILMLLIIWDNFAQNWSQKKEQIPFVETQILQEKVRALVSFGGPSKNNSKILTENQLSYFYSYIQIIARIVWFFLLPEITLIEMGST